MKIRLAKPIRRDWSGHPAATVLLDRDLSVRGSRLKAKLLVFPHRRAMRRFWTKGLGHGFLGQTCMGAVTSLTSERMLFPKGKPEQRWIEADPHYFCVIGLVKGFLSMEIICHEAVHAGFAYAKRVKRSPWNDKALEFDEEAVCYPAGAIAGAINRAIYKAGLHE